MYASYRTIARRLGLRMTPTDPNLFTTVVQLSGELQNHPVRIRRLIGAHTLETEVHLSPALDLGLDVTPAGQPSYPGPFGTLRWIGRLFSRADLHVGDKELDDALAVHGDEQARVRTLLEPLRGPLLKWHEAQRHFHVTDSLVNVRRYSASPSTDDPEEIAGDLEGAIDLAVCIEKSRVALTPAAALEPHLRCFEDFAQAHGAELLRTPLALWGTLGGRTFWARALRLAPSTFEVVISLELATPIATTEQGRRFELSLTAGKPGSTSGGRWSGQALEALANLRAAGHSVDLDERGLVMRRRLDFDTYDLDAFVSSAELVLDGVEAAFKSRSGYR